MKGKKGEKFDKGEGGGNGPVSTSPGEDAREHPDLSFSATADAGGCKRGLFAPSSSSFNQA